MTSLDLDIPMVSNFNKDLTDPDKFGTLIILTFDLYHDLTDLDMFIVFLLQVIGLTGELTYCIFLPLIVGLSEVCWGP